MSLKTLLTLESVSTVCPTHSSDIRMCRICLVSDVNVKLFNMNKYVSLRKYFYHLINMMAMKNDSKVPQYLCWECTRHLMKSNELRVKALKSNSILSSLLEANQPISGHKLNKLTRSTNNLSSSLKTVLIYDENICFNPNDDDDMVIEELDEEILKEEYVLKITKEGREILKETELRNDAAETDVTDEQDNGSVYEEYIDVNIDEDEIDGDTIANKYESIRVMLDELHRDSGESANNEIDSRYITQMSKEINKSKINKNIITSDVTQTKPDKKNKKIVQTNIQNEDEKAFDDSIKMVNLASIDAGVVVEQRGRKRKRYDCNVCGKNFPQSSNLKTHIRTHTGEKPYPCHICGRAFNNTSHLKRHIRIHTGEKPYCCRICGKAFNQSMHLKTHLNLHTSMESPYTCDMCPKKFKHKHSLEGHLQNHMVLLERHRVRRTTGLNRRLRRRDEKGE